MVKICPTNASPTLVHKPTMYYRSHQPTLLACDEQRLLSECSLRYPSIYMDITLMTSADRRLGT